MARKIQGEFFKTINQKHEQGKTKPNLKYLEINGLFQFHFGDQWSNWLELSAASIFLVAQVHISMSSRARLPAGETGENDRLLSEGRNTEGSLTLELRGDEN